MKNLFILGAGASRAAGGPLMSDFLDCSEKLIRLNTDGVIQAKEAFNDAFEALAELQAVHAKSYLDLDNIEVLFGAIEMAQMICKLGERDQKKIIKLRNSIITLIYKTLEYSIKFPIRSQHIDPPLPYDSFIKALSEIKRKRQENYSDEHYFTFLTFNYDLALDYAIQHEGMKVDYCLTGDNIIGEVPLLKLHGSINWGVCEKCKKIVPFHIHEVRPNPINLFDSQVFYYALGSNLHHKSCCEKPLKGPPVLIPPTWNKTGYHAQLGNVWKRAADELSKAENIFVIGYSLPETDSFFRYLFALGSESPTRIKRFWVFNPDTEGGVEKRFRDLIGRGLENRFQYHPVGFALAIQEIKKALGQP